MPLSPGERLGPYEIISLIGEGGMGEVWKARDTLLDRVVAIKQLKAEHSARFQQEARAIARLNHPQICQIYNVGPDYLVMEYIDGPPLRGPMSVKDALQIAIQIADALEEAHAHGVLHRDLKPANILVAAKGGAKLLDFGLAKMKRSESEDQTVLTVDGTVLGTSAYMSPEQAQGKLLDERSDIFSFGAVLYEMLSGRKAFAGDSMVDVLSSVIRDEPLPLSAPSEISGVVRRCLRKHSAERFQTMLEVKAALEQCASPSGSAGRPPETQPSIAVLAFANLSADKENEYFSDGLAEEILNALTQVEGLKVAARASSFSFKGKGAEMSDIGAKLHVATVLDGSVRRAGNRVRVTVQLVDVANGFQLWSERYDRQIEDIFEVQDEIARAITEKLKVTLGSGVKQSTKNPEAYDLYLKGRHFWHQRSPGTLRLAIEAFEAAIKLDPGYALAYAGLADCYGIFRIYGWVRADDLRAKAYAAVTEAVSLDPSLWEVHFSRAVYALSFERDWRQAEPHFRKAAEINPRASLVQAYYGVLLAVEGREEDSCACTKLARQMDPLAPFIHVFSAAAAGCLRNFDDWERHSQQALELQPGYLFALWNHGLALCGLGRAAEAIDPLERVVAVSRAPVYLGFLGLAYTRAGRHEDGNQLMRELEDRASRGENVPAFVHLYFHAGRDDLAAIRKALPEAVTDLSVLFLVLAVSLFSDAARNDPEIHQLLLRI